MLIVGNHYLLPIAAVRLVNQRKHIQSQIHHTAAHTVAEEARKILRQDQQVVQQPVSVAV